MSNTIDIINENSFSAQQKAKAQLDEIQKQQKLLEKKKEIKEKTKEEIEESKKKGEYLYPIYIIDMIGQEVIEFGILKKMKILLINSVKMKNMQRNHLIVFIHNIKQIIHKKENFMKNQQKRN